jgi:ribosome-associated translation inhibitor RaiA
MSNTNIKSLNEKIKNLNNKQAYINIYKILKNNSVKLNINKNGIYFNINDLNDDLIKAIDELIYFYKIQGKQT